MHIQCLINWIVTTVQYMSHTDSMHYQSLTSSGSLIFTVLHLHCDHASHNPFSSTGVLSCSDDMYYDDTTLITDVHEIKGQKDKLLLI